MRFERKTDLRRKPQAKRFFACFLAAILLIAACPFCTYAKADPNVIRVLLTKLALTDRMTVSLDGSYTIGDFSFQRGSQITVSCKTGTLMIYYEGIAWNAGKEARLIRHEAEQGKENGLRINGGYPLYAGDLRISIADGNLNAVLHIPVEEYLLGVVPYEMSDAFPLEALKAQAVAARTYALRKVGTGGSYDLVDNTNDQVYRGYQKENGNANRAVKETAGVCGFYGKSPANCYYSASNGGQVEIPEHVWGKSDGDYITMHEDPYDVENPESLVKKATVKKAPAEGLLGNGAFTGAVKLLLSEPLAAKGYTGEAEDIRILSVESMEMLGPKTGDPSLVMTALRTTLKVKARRVPSQAMTDDEEMSIFQVGQPTATAQPTPTAAPQGAFVIVPEPITVDIPVFPTVKQLLGLGINSTDNEIITVHEKEDAFELQSRRYGHGVGMSQRGAQWMASKYGWKYEQILRFYYPGLTFKAVDTNVALPTPLTMEYLSTPGPAASPTPRPTLMPVSAAPQKGEWKAQVTRIGVNSYLNLRAAPSMDAEVLRQLYYGQMLIVTETLPDGWLRVKTDVMEGYVMEQFVEKKD